MIRSDTASSQRQIHHGPFNHDPLGRIVNGPNLCRILNRDTFIVPTRVRCEFAEESGKPMGAELTAKWIDGQGAKESLCDS